MLSTQTPTNLPTRDSLQHLCKALAVLDAIISPEEEYRYHTYDAHWGEGEEVFEMNDGEGDQMLILFRPEGCVINGYADGLDEPDKAQLTHGLPAVFHEFVFGEPVNSIGTTFCLWSVDNGDWQLGEGVTEEDGSDELLYILDGRPQTYVEWASEYFDENEDKKPINPITVAQIYQGQTLTKAMVLSLVDEIENWTSLEAELKEIGYPYDFS